MGLVACSWFDNNPRDYLPYFVTLNAHSTRDKARPRPTLAPWCTDGPSACPTTESARNDPRLEPEENSLVLCENKKKCEASPNRTLFRYAHILQVRFESRCVPTGRLLTVSDCYPYYPPVAISGFAFGGRTRGCCTYWHSSWTSEIPRNHHVTANGLCGGHIDIRLRAAYKGLQLERQ